MKSRREFLATTAALGSFPFIPHLMGMDMEIEDVQHPKTTAAMINGEKSIIGGYGPWAASLADQPPPLSFRHPSWNSPKKWRKKALAKTKELLAAPSLGEMIPQVEVKASYEYDGLVVEELAWQLPYGRPTSAVLLKPAGVTKALPGILGLHDHGGNKYFGNRKIANTAATLHPDMKAHQSEYYSGLAWANELAKRGYVVLVHDVFTFGSRRVWYQDMASIPWGACRVDDKSDDHPEASENIAIYNQWAGEHEHIMAKSLFCAGTTWPGITLAEDQRALDILCARPDVDANQVGCCGLSGGGLRTDYLGGLDHRIKCAVSVGFMTTWRDLLLNKSYTHTWMTYTPLLPRYMEFPEILGIRAPLPTMVLSSEEDQLFTLSEMKKADEILQAIFAKAGASAHYSGKFYPGIHKFDAVMQQDAFDWFDRWLGKSG
ncbi:MAG: hypothetical protein R2828_05845 [Saprospiraceae bacterium]